MPFVHSLRKNGRQEPNWDVVNRIGTTRMPKACCPIRPWDKACMAVQGQAFSAVRPSSGPPFYTSLSKPPNAPTKTQSDVPGLSLDPLSSLCARYPNKVVTTYCTLFCQVTGQGGGGKSSLLVGPCFSLSVSLSRFLRSSWCYLSYLSRVSTTREFLALLRLSSVNNYCYLIRNRVCLSRVVSLATYMQQHTTSRVPFSLISLASRVLELRDPRKTLVSWLFGNLCNAQRVTLCSYPPRSSPPATGANVTPSEVNGAEWGGACPRHSNSTSAFSPEQDPPPHSTQRGLERGTNNKAEQLCKIEHQDPGKRDCHFPLYNSIYVIGEITEKEIPGRVTMS